MIGALQHGFLQRARAFLGAGQTKQEKMLVFPEKFLYNVAYCVMK
jgi:hypothetical protein